MGSRYIRAKKMKLRDSTLHLYIVDNAKRYAPANKIIDLNLSISVIGAAFSVGFVLN